MTVTARCGGALHRLTWRRGRLVLEDHPHHEAERALVALGASNVCLDVLDAWAARSWDTLHVLHALQAVHHPAASGEEVADLVNRQHRRGFVPPPGMDAATAAGIRAAIARHDIQQLVSRLPPRLALRWAHGAVVHHERGWMAQGPMERLDLEIGLHTLVTAALVQSATAWRRVDSVRPVELEVAMAAPSERPAVEARVAGRSLTGRACVRLSWLVEVWARGRAVVEGCLVLSVVGDRAEVVRWERSGPAAATAVTVPARLWRDGAGRWHLRW